MKYRSGYEQGKIEGAWVGNQLKDADKIRREFNKAKVPQCVAEKIEYFKKTDDWDLFQAMDYLFGEKETRQWLEYKNNQETFARAWLDGYEVEKEKLYFVKITAAEQYLVRVEDENFLGFLQSRLKSKFTRKQLEETGFGWVFSCEGIEVEEVTD